VNQIIGYPNPAGESFFVKGIVNDQRNAQIQLFNTAGKSIPLEWHWRGDAIEFDIENLASGNYYLKISGIGFTKNISWIKL
jgi:hypothetical protein